MTYDVVVAGAGPVGLLLAAELRLGGARVLVLERDADPARPRKAGSMGARALNGPSVAALHLRGLVPALRENAFFWYDPENEEEPAEEGAGSFEPGFIGHFAGIGIRADRLDFTDPELTGEPLGAGVVAQQDLETVLARHAAGLGAEIRRGVAVTGFAAGEGGVRVRAGATEIEAGWLVGCDGGRGTVRKLVGFDFPGVDPIFTGRQAIVDMTGGEGLTASDWRPGVNGSYVVGGWGEDGKSRVHTVEFTPPPDRDTEVTAAEIQDSLRRLSGVEVTVTAVHAATRYADTTRQASTYRRGRVLLAGDAAHVHSPAGGQGLNLGLGDAMNLGWKLAAVARGFAPESLVDTYTAERHPIGAWVQRWSMAQTAVSVPGDPRVAALREVLGELLDTPHGATYVLKKIGGGWQHYDLPGDHPLLGRRAPDFVLGDGTTFAGHAATGAGILLDPRGEVGGIAAPWGDRVRVVTAAPVGFPDAPAAFVRPDGYVAWVSGGQETLADSLRAWLGEPSASR
ncbi:FAD-dependent monooxygenase [Amycolatopsis samaneae]|uniref:FAD-dependent monooxygenase n=1 Tax=Amycolatopsis samaneae TaxID=664691 RepID=A0ABW5GVM1_9PSEU